MNLGIDQISKFPFLFAFVSSRIDPSSIYHKIKNLFDPLSKLGILIIFKRKLLNEKQKNNIKKSDFTRRLNRINVYYIIETRYTKLTFPVLTTQWHKNLYQLIYDQPCIYVYVYHTYIYIYRYIHTGY